MGQSGLSFDPLAIGVDITIQSPNIADALRELERLGPAAAKSLERSATRASFLVQRESIRNAPRSPSQKIVRALRKTRRKTKRKDRAVSRPNPAGLERSIARDVIVGPDGVTASVFVASNSEAGRYAARIHDGKGLTWRNRGPGTIQKGARADDKFMDRAVIDNEAVLLEIINDEAGKVTK